MPLTCRAAATSRANLARNSRSAASSARISFTATSRPPGDWPRNTCPMPPAPSRPSSWYRPTRRGSPDSNGFTTRYPRPVPVAARRLAPVAGWSWRRWPPGGWWWWRQQPPRGWWSWRRWPPVRACGQAECNPDSAPLREAGDCPGAGNGSRPDAAHRHGREKLVQRARQRISCGIWHSGPLFPR